MPTTFAQLSQENSDLWSMLRIERAANERLRADNVMMANALAKKIGTEHLDEIARLRAAIERMGIGCNHIATYRTDHWPDYGSHPQTALEALGAGREYDMWCCWNAHMCARDSLADAGRVQT